MGGLETPKGTEIPGALDNLMTAGEWHKRVNTLGMTTKVWGEWAGGEKDTGVTGAVQKNGVLAGDHKGCGAQGS